MTAHSTSTPEPAAADGLDPDDPAAELADLSDDAWSSLHHLSRALRVDEANLDSTLLAVLTTTTETFAFCEGAGLNLIERGKFVPQVVIGEAPPLLDRWQQRNGTGPCIDASREQIVVDVADMRDNVSWPGFAELAIEVGVLSMLCLPLWVDNRRLGSLSLYGARPRAFAEPSVQNIAAMLATHAALALADAQRTEQLRRVIANRDVIGQAKGILMERHRITAEEAFALLTSASQHTNRKLAAVAEVLASTGQLPGPTPGLS